jgi:hypothetical protein
MRRKLAFAAVAVALAAGGVAGAVAANGDDDPADDDGVIAQTVVTETFSNAPTCVFTEPQGEVTSDC